MSDLSNKKAPTVTEPLGGAASLGAQVDSKVKPVTIWAAIGGALLVLQLYVWIRWITGPYFKRVPGGPTDPPMYMKAFLTFNGILMCVGLPIAIWWFIVRPWRRERQNHARRHADGVDGPDVLPGPAAQLLQHVVHLQHMAVEPGLVVVGHSGWVSPEEPGRQVAEPLLINAPGYTAAYWSSRSSDAG